MKNALCLLVLVLLTACSGRKGEIDAEVEPAAETVRSAVDLKQVEPELDDFVLQMTVGYKHLRPFLQEEIPQVMFEELFRDIRLDFESKRKTVKPGALDWLNQTTIARRGVGLLSVHEDQVPAAVRIDQHHYRDNGKSEIGRDIHVRKPNIWDQVTLNGKEYSRLLEAGVWISVLKQGVTQVTIDFHMAILPLQQWELAPVSRFAGEHKLYALRGFYTADMGNGFRGRAGSWFAQYEPNDPVKVPDMVTYLTKSSGYKSPETLSKVVLCSADFSFSQRAKKELLEVIDLVVISQARKPGKSGFRELLDHQPYRLHKELDPD